MNESIWEDSLLERKVESDTKDILKTLVGFANSVAPGHVATLLIGEADDGTIKGLKNPDNIQKRVRHEADKIYPPILFRQSVYEIEGKSCVKVEVENNGETPHFSGGAFIRQGSETIKATDSQFQNLIALRLSKVYELQKWINKEVTIVNLRGSSKGAYYQDILTVENMHGPLKIKIVSVNNFFVTYESIKSTRAKQDKYSEPLDRLLISYDHNHDSLQLMLA